MPFWPFKRKEPEINTPEELRTQLIEAAGSGSPERLRAMCVQYKGMVAANLDLMTKPPDGVLSNPAAMEEYIQRLGAVAQCLANQCGAPELWNKLTGPPDRNPFVKWERWFAELPQRAQRLEHPALIDEARRLISETQHLQGTAARQNEAFLYGRLGELLFHSGQVREAIEPFRAAIELCQKMGDFEGEGVHLNNVLESHRYLGEIAETLQTSEQLVAHSQQHGQACDDLRKRLDRIAAGEPLCRIVCCREGQEMELNEVSLVAAGRYEFQFRRNRLSLQMGMVHTRQGNELASSGNLADALEKYQTAMEVDPFDPDPVYQSGTCLLELGAYGKAREAFEEVERLAPGWFRCRSDRWLAESLGSGAVSDEEFRLLRTLEDGGLPKEKALPLAKKAAEDYPTFAPFQLILGDLYQQQGDKHQAELHYRKGLESVAEPDLESRLLCSLAGILPKESSERQSLVKRALGLKGSLVAQATALLIGL
jgi:tetratricopeptide (TPR) repeat protein